MYVTRPAKAPLQITFLFLPPAPDELLPGSHPADEDQPDLLLVPGLAVLPALRPPGGALPAQHRGPALRHREQRLRRGHGREEQLLRGVPRQLARWAWPNGLKKGGKRRRFQAGRFEANSLLLRFVCAFFKRRIKKRNFANFATG